MYKLLNTILITSLFTLFTFCNSSNITSNPEVEIDNTNKASVTTIENIDAELITLEGCKPFKGYFQNTIDCVTETTFESIIKFDGQVNNIVQHKEDFYFVLNNGEVFKHNKSNLTNDQIFDFSDKLDPSNEMGGLRGLVFHPSEAYILISYVKAIDLYSLYVEKIEIDENLNVLSSNIIYKVDDVSTQRNHFGGHLVWSNFYEGFLLGVGDFYESSAESRLNPDPLDTTKPYGKILLLQSEVKISAPSISKNKELKNLDNIVAMGLRNSWQFFEYKNYLIVADVGLSVNEELNITKVSKKTLNFGWPIYEGLDTSEKIDQIKNYKLDISYWQDNSKNSINEYFAESYESPVFQYSHNPNEEIYRAAIIGGDIFKNLNSKYSQKIFVAEYLTGELFSIDLITRNVSIFEIDNLNKNVTSLRVYDEINNKLIISTQDGEILVLKLP